MYSYYCLAALGPQFRKYLWWKKALTIIQMVSIYFSNVKTSVTLHAILSQVQFVVALIHACLPLFVDCGYQPFFAYTLMAHAVLFWVMFYNFYNKSYNTNSSKRLLNDEHTHDCHTNGFKKSSPSVANGNGTNHQKTKQG